MLLSNTSTFQRLVKALYFRRVTRVVKVFMTLCSPVQVKNQERRKQKQIKPIALPRRSVI
jgi:hypothetical protein